MLAGARLRVMDPKDRATVRALVELLVTLGETLPHMVDTRRLAALAALAPDDDLVLTTLRYAVGVNPPWCVYVEGEIIDVVADGLTAAEALDAVAAEALDAAEREAQP